MEINRKNYKNGDLGKLNTLLKSKDAKVFMLIYMEGCGPCNATRPEWSKIRNVLSRSALDAANVTVVAVDKDVFDQVENAGSEPSGFPTIRFITNAGGEIETYEDSDIENKDRSVDSFVAWIKHKTGKDLKPGSATSSKKTLKGGRRTRRHRRTRRRTRKCRR